MPDGGASYPAANYRAGMYAATPPGNNSPGSWSNTLQAYVDGNFYRDQTIVLDPSFPAVNLTQIKALQARGFTWIFTNPVAKSTTQRLTLTYRISLA